MTGLGEALLHAAAQLRGERLLDGRCAQAPWFEDPRGGIDDQGGEHFRSVRARRPDRRHEQDRELLHPAREESEERQRRLVRPLCVVDQEREWTPAREVGTEPVQAMQARVDRVLTAGFFHRCAGIEQRRGELCGSREPLVALRFGRGRHQRIEQLAHDTKREALLKLRAASPTHVHPRLAREPARGSQKRGLTDPRRALDHHQAPDPMPRMVHRTLQVGCLQLAL